MLKNGPISLSARVFMPSDMHTNVIPAQWQKHGVDKCGHGFKKAHNKDYNLIFQQQRRMNILGATQGQ